MCDIKLCKDCKHSKYNGNFLDKFIFKLESSFWRCLHPNTNTLNPVYKGWQIKKQDLITGKPKRVSIPFCEVIRCDYLPEEGYCGSEAKWFERKDTDVK